MVTEVNLVLKVHQENLVHGVMLVAMGRLVNLAHLVLSEKLVIKEILERKVYLELKVMLVPLDFLEMLGLRAREVTKDWWVSKENRVKLEKEDKLENLAEQVAMVSRECKGLKVSREKLANVARLE